MTLILLAALLAPSPQIDIRVPAGAAPDGVAGVCIRWADHPGRVEEAVVVRPSGNAALDRALPRTIREMEWARPAGDTGAWMGIVMAVGDTPLPPAAALPDCSRLPDHRRTPPARPAA